MLLYGYIPLLITFILMGLGMFLIFTMLPTLSNSRANRGKKLSFKPSDIIKNLSMESSPDKNSSYTETYESGEVARGSYNSFVRVQYYFIILPLKPEPPSFQLHSTPTQMLGAIWSYFFPIP